MAYFFHSLTVVNVFTLENLAEEIGHSQDYELGSLVMRNHPSIARFRSVLSHWKMLARWRRKVIWKLDCMTEKQDDILDFRCNACGNQTSNLRTRFTREEWTCYECGSTVRLRSVIHALSNELFGESLALPDFPHRPDITGVGLTDWDGYASGLAEKFSYTNTYYHQEPYLDIMSIDTMLHGLYDFIIASDVFEHTAPPVTKAFENAQRLLKPNGVMILTVPYVAGTTKEHFPELHRFSLHQQEEGWVLHNQTADGRSQEFSDITFHGGPGTVVEMRLFGMDSLLQDLQRAGFKSVRIYNEDYPESGIFWIPYDAEKSPYRPPIYGLDTPAWALRKHDPRANSPTSTRLATDGVG